MKRFSFLSMAALLVLALGGAVIWFTRGENASERTSQDRAEDAFRDILKRHGVAGLWNPARDSSPLPFSELPSAGSYWDTQTGETVIMLACEIPGVWEKTPEAVIEVTGTSGIRYRLARYTEADLENALQQLSIWSAKTQAPDTESLWSRVSTTAWLTAQNRVRVEIVGLTDAEAARIGREVQGSEALLLVSVQARVNPLLEKLD